MCFHKKPSFYQTGGWGPGCEIDSVDLISGLFKKLKFARRLPISLSKRTA
jgi:hypothetical protein